MLAKIMRFLGMIIIGIIIIISVLLVLPFEKYVIQSGSMEPTLPVGSIIYVSNEKPENINLKLNDQVRITDSNESKNSEIDKNNKEIYIPTNNKGELDANSTTKIGLNDTETTIY